MPSFFTDAALRCHCGCDLLRLHPGFRSRLDTLRERLAAPMVPTSCCRCRQYNTQIGGHSKSLHIGDYPQQPLLEGTAAIDIATPDGTYRGRLFSAAWELGWSVGWNAKKGFLHLDRRDFAGLAQTSFDY